MYRNETDKLRDLNKTVSQAEQEFAMDLKTFAVEVTADEKLLKTLFGAKHTCPNTRRIQTLPEATDSIDFNEIVFFHFTDCDELEITLSFFFTFNLSLAYSYF